MTKLTEHTNHSFERVERFVSLRNGEYWQAKRSVTDRGITQGEVLMIAGIDDVDSLPHTIHVRLHPSKVTSYKKEVKFLVDEFMSSFEYFGEEKGLAVRDAELKAIQNKLQTEQEILQKACTDMEIIDRLIAAESQPDPGTANLPVKYEAVGADVIGAIRTQKVSALMSSGLTAKGIEQIKAGMEEQRDIAVKRSDWITKRTKALAQIAEEMTPYFEEKAAVALALTKDMRDHVDALMKGIGNLNLYVLKNVEIETLREGRSASEDIKLSITQSVLYMDEELAVFEDINDQFDCHNRDVFFAAVTKHPGLIDQIFPTMRCVVALATTRKNHDYQSRGYDIMTAVELTRENQRRFLLVRDGENIHLVLSPELWHQFSKTLFPTVDESEAPFKGFDGRTITYRDLEYTNALAKHDAIALGYKRLLILLCGLDHNKKLFGDFYPGEPSLDFISMAFQEAHFNFIHDADGRGMLPPHCPLSINDWIDQMNEEIGAGSRVIIRWDKLFTVDTIPSCFERSNRWNSLSGQHRSLQYHPADSDQNGFIEGHLVNHKGHLVLEIPVKGETQNYETRKFMAKLDMAVAMTSASRFDYLCVDRLNPDEANWYLRNRPSRKLNVSGIRMLKRAIKLSQDDRQHEKPLRDALFDSLMAGHVSGDEAAAIHLIDKGIAKYKCAHPKTEIVSLLTDRKAFNALCNQLYQLSSKGRDLTDEIKASEQTLGRKPLRISLLANGQYCAYSTPLAHEVDNRMMEFTWVAKTCYKAAKQGVSAQRPSFALLQSAANSETILYEADDLKNYIHHTVPVFKTPNAKAKFLYSIIAAKGNQTWKQILAMRHDAEAIDRFITAYNDYRYQLTSLANVKTVIEPCTRVVIGAVAVESKLYKLAMECDTDRLIHWLIADNHEAIARFSDIYAKIYSKKDKARERFALDVETYKDRSLYDNLRLQLIDPSDNEGLFVNAAQSIHVDRDAYQRYSLSACIRRLRDQGKSVFINPEIGDDLDAWLGIKRPADFELFVCHDDGFCVDHKVDIFRGTDETISKLRRHVDVLNSWREVEARFKQIKYRLNTGQGTFRVTCEWDEVAPRTFRGVSAYKSFVYKEIARVPED